MPPISVPPILLYMSTLTKKPSAKKKPMRKVVARKSASRLIPPPARGSGDDLLKSLQDGSFDKAAAKVDWDMVESACKNRRSSR